VVGDNNPTPTEVNGSENSAGYVDQALPNLENAASNLIGQSGNTGQAGNSATAPSQGFFSQTVSAVEGAASSAEDTIGNAASSAVHAGGNALSGVHDAVHDFSHNGVPSFVNNVFSDEEEARAYAEQVHNAYRNSYGGRLRPKPTHAYQLAYPGNYLKQQASEPYLERSSHKSPYSIPGDNLESAPRPQVPFRQEGWAETPFGGQAYQIAGFGERAYYNGVPDVLTIDVRSPRSRPTRNL